MTLSQLTVRALGSVPGSTAVTDRFVESIDGFETADYMDLVIAKRAEYRYISEDMTFTTTLANIRQRLDNEHKIQIVGFEPQTYVQLSIPSIGSVYVNMDISTITQLGQVNSDGLFEFTPDTEDVMAWETDVDGRAGFVYIRNRGVFSWENTVEDTMTYTLFKKGEWKDSDTEKEMGDIIESKLTAE